MPEPLRREQPSSSVATLFRKDVARAAVATPSAQPHVPPPADERQSEPVARPDTRPATAAAPTGEPAAVLRQFQLTDAADNTLRRVMRAYSEASGLDLNRSEFLRALLAVLEHTIPHHDRAARAIGPLRRPKNDPWLLHKRDELERQLARALHAAFRAAPPME